MDLETSDICLAATLLMFGAQLQNITVEGRRGTFVLVNADQKTLDDFQFGRCLVEPARFNSTVRFLSGAVVKLIAKTP
jgi:hypothetical protein